MVDVRIREAEGCGGNPYLVWDTVWVGDGLNVEQEGDWTLAGADEPDNRGGLTAKAGIASAAILCLFTDRRCPDDHPLRYLAEDPNTGFDPRGWWGDAVEVDGTAGEGELGSLLWLLERAPATEEMRRWAEELAYEALEPLLRQQVVARILCAAILNEVRGRIELEVALIGRDGSTVYARRFEDLWRQLG